VDLPATTGRSLRNKGDRYFYDYVNEVVMSLFKSENDSHKRLEALWLLGSLVSGFMVAPGWLLSQYYLCQLTHK
jgi:hypothetical protein